MGIFDRFRRRAPAGPEGVVVRVRAPKTVRAEAVERRVPRPLFWGLLLAVAFYILAHLSIVQGVWPVHGTAPGAGGILVRDAFALLAWLALLAILRAMKFRGSWAVVILPIIVFLLIRPSLFQVFTDPVYQAKGGSRVEANALKAERAQLTTVLRTYDEGRMETVFQGEPPALPDPLEVAAAAAERESGSALRLFSIISVLLAPLAMLLGFWFARRPEWLRRFRDYRLWPFLAVLVVFFGLAMLPEARATGKVAGTTPWELFLPLFIATWAVTLAEDAYNLARPGAVFAPRRLLNLVLYGALPIIPFLILHELGLSIVLAGSLATMLLVGTRRAWWAALMLGVWAVLVLIAFNLDERSRTRLELAYEPYKDLSAMTAEGAEAWAAKLHQIKLFDANILAGNVFGQGPGRGHAETAPNAADDGYITMVSAQWGLAGALSLVLLYTLFVVQMLRVAVAERGAFERTLVTGLAMLIAIPFWLATLGGIRLIPLTGVAAAFAANGGAKLLASALGVGIIAGISHRRAEEERLQEVLGEPAVPRPAEGVRIR